MDNEKMNELNLEEMEEVNGGSGSGKKRVKDVSGDGGMIISQDGFNTNEGDHMRQFKTETE